MRKKSIFLTLAGVAIYGLSYGQSDQHPLSVTVPSVSLIDLASESSPTVTFTFTAPTVPGEAVVSGTPANEDAYWLNYSYIKTTTTASARIQANLSAAIPGVTIKLSAAAAAADGGGTKGTSGSTSAPITLSTSAVDVITGIGSSYTGTGTSKGHQLTYSAELGTYSDLVTSASTTVNVVYTISTVN